MTPIKFPKARRLGVPAAYAKHGFAMTPCLDGLFLRFRCPMNVIQEIEREQINAVTAKRGVPEFGPGDTVKVMVKVIEGVNVRTQAFEGVVIGRSGAGI